MVRRRFVVNVASCRDGGQLLACVTAGDIKGWCFEDAYREAGGYGQDVVLSVKKTKVGEVSFTIMPNLEESDGRTDLGRTRRRSPASAVES